MLSFLIGVVVVGLTGVFYLMYTDLRERENREQLKEIERLNLELARLENEVRLLKARLREPEDKSRFKA